VKRLASGRICFGLAYAGLLALALMGACAVVAIHAPTAQAQATGPSPDPAPPPPTPAPPSEPSPPPTTTTQVQPTVVAPKPKRHRRAATAPTRPFHTAPEEAPVYRARGDPTHESPLARLVVSPAASTGSGGSESSLFLPLVLSFLGIAFVLLAIAMAPERTLANVSVQLPARRLEFAFTGGTLFVGVALAFAMVELAV
jgi:hypothetical protein